jgi:hypothetical protein
MAFNIQNGWCVSEGKLQFQFLAKALVTCRSNCHHLVFGFFIIEKYGRRRRKLETVCVKIKAKLLMKKTDVKAPHLKDVTWD